MRVFGRLSTYCLSRRRSRVRVPSGSHKSHPFVDWVAFFVLVGYEVELSVDVAEQCSAGSSPFRILLLLLLASACTKNAMVPADGVAHPISTNDDPDQRYTYAGLPESVDYPHPLSLLAYRGFITAYDEIRGNPAWVAYRVFAVPEYISTARPSRFLTDENTESRISHDDSSYRKTPAGISRIPIPERRTPGA